MALPLPAGVNYQLLLTIGAACMALFVIVLRLRATKKPTSAKKILMPPIGMSTGFFMFVFPQTHIPLTYALFALLVGCLFAVPLIKTSKMAVDGGDVYLKPSKVFPFILLGFLAIRIVLHDVVQNYVSLEQTASIFFILAFGMLAPWRLAMYARFRKLLSDEGNGQLNVTDS
ncbi:CcdC family protein [Numidum massiliense]|uniref:CcdC family protein n=1 Tax=Numidum massiliense TaxID=1522315 RepID=UPI0009406521|nr:cytochrome c biogenesis protein CcdC [Numidum massiliense]